MVNMSAIINVTSRLFFSVTGFESILEGLFGPGLFKDITLFQGKHAQTHKPTASFKKSHFYDETFLFQNKITK